MGNHRAILLATLLAACVGAPARIVLDRGAGELAEYDYDDAELRRDTEGRWSVTLLRRDRSYSDAIVESIVVPLPNTLAEDARHSLRPGRALEFWYAPMARGTAVRFPKGEAVVESWDPRRRRVRGRFSATRREAKQVWSIQGTFDARFAGE